MADLTLRTQSVFETLAGLWNSLPFWLAIGLLFAPTFLALITRSWITIFSVALLNTACLLVILSGTSSNTAVPLAIVTFFGSLIFAAYGLRERRLWQTLTELEARVSQVDQQMMTFLKALETRSDMIDETADEARRAFDEARKQLPKALPAFQVRGPQSSAETASMSVPTYSPPPIIKT